MLTVIVPCSNRISLYQTLESCKEAEKVFVVADGVCNVSYDIAKTFNNVEYFEIQSTADFGASQRNFAMRLVKTPLMSFLDDDDVYVKEGVSKILSYSKLDALNIFKIQFKNMVVWKNTEVEYGNVSTSGFVVPNTPSKLGVWTCRYGTDFDFASMTYKLIKRVNFIDFILTKARPHEQ